MIYITRDVMIKILKQMETLNKLSGFLVNFYLLEVLMDAFIYKMYMYNIYNVYV